VTRQTEPPEEADYKFLVTVRVYGPASAEDAAQVLKSYANTFDVSYDAEVEIMDVQVVT